MPDTKIPTKCPDNVLCGVNMVCDCENMTDLEKKHLPVITAPDTVGKGEFFEVTIEVGKLLAHPSEPAHHIDFIELYADHTYLARVHFTGRTTKPTVKLWISLDHIHCKLRAFSYCNLHGNWGGCKKIQVTEY
jgi:superoxide reductase